MLRHIPFSIALRDEHAPAVPGLFLEPSAEGPAYQIVAEEDGQHNVVVASVFGRERLAGDRTSPRAMAELLGGSAAMAQSVDGLLTAVGQVMEVVDTRGSDFAAMREATRQVVVRAAAARAAVEDSTGKPLKAPWIDHLAGRSSDYGVVPLDGRSSFATYLQSRGVAEDKIHLVRSYLTDLFDGPIEGAPSVLHHLLRRHVAAVGERTWREGVSAVPPEVLVELVPLVDHVGVPSYLRSDLSIIAAREGVAHV